MVQKRLTMKEAALYVNDGLNRKWKNPMAAIESNIYRKKIKLSAHGKRNQQRTFEVKELDRFILAKNTAPAPAGGRNRVDLSKYALVFGYATDSHIATLAKCSAITVQRYRQANNIPNYRDAGLARIRAIRNRLGREPASKLAAEIKVNRMTIVNFMREHSIPAYKRSST